MLVHIIDNKIYERGIVFAQQIINNEIILSAQYNMVGVTLRLFSTYLQAKMFCCMNCRTITDMKTAKNTK